jgi:hypothetical protein
MLNGYELYTIAIRKSNYTKNTEERHKGTQRNFVRLCATLCVLRALCAMEILHKNMND